VQSEVRQRSFNIGDSVNFSLPGLEQGSVTVSNGDNQSLSLTENNVLIASEPGILTASIGDSAARYAVNILPEESNLARLPLSTLYDAVVNPDTSPLQSRAVQTAQLIEELERPQRLWWWILGLVMLLLLMEAVIANRTYR
jgi:hypothetical protein